MSQGTIQCPHCYKPIAVSVTIKPVEPGGYIELGTDVTVTFAEVERDARVEFIGWRNTTRSWAQCLGRN